MTVNFTPHNKMISRQHELGKAIILFLVKRYKIESAAEFGCGPAQFLSMLIKSANIGKDDFVGYDGTDYGKSLKINSFNFCKIDFTKLSSRANFLKYDIIISLEVAEHIPEEKADNFIGLLVGHAKNLILFSAAVPGQGGDHHVNEQPHEYWHSKFKQHGFIAKDIIRPIIKSNKNVASWFRNNIFVYER